MLQPAPTLGPPPPDLERYFELDPILDPPQWGQPPGWFSDVRLDVIHPHIFFGQMKHSVQFPSGRSVLVAPGAAQQLLDGCSAARGGLSAAVGLRGVLLLRSVL